MTIAHAIEYYDRLRDNHIPQEVKIQALSELDMRLNRDVLVPRGLGKADFAGYDCDVDQETELLASEDFRDMYFWFLAMKIARLQGEADEYNAALQNYDEYIIGYADAVNRVHPCAPTPLRLV